MMENENSVSKYSIIMALLLILLLSAPRAYVEHEAAAEIEVSGNKLDSLSESPNSFIECPNLSSEIKTTQAATTPNPARQTENAGEDSKSEESKHEEKPQVCLTFDDGPRKSTTPKILDILKEKNVRATFFVIGQRAESSPEILKRIVEEGHLLGNHTQNHEDLLKLTTEEAREEIEKANDVIKNAGAEVKYLRPPFGNYDESMNEIFDELGVKVVCWHVDTLDWKSKDPDKIVAEALDQVHDGSIILMHDIYPTTVDAVAGLIDALRNDGYEFVQLDQLLSV